MDFRRQRTVNRTPLRYFKQPLLLCFIEIAGKFDLTVDAIQKSIFRFTFLAIVSMNSEVFEPDRNAPQVDTFPLRVQPQRHGRARS